MHNKFIYKYYVLSWLCCFWQYLPVNVTEDQPFLFFFLSTSRNLPVSKLLIHWHTFNHCQRIQLPVSSILSLGFCIKLHNNIVNSDGSSSSTWYLPACVWELLKVQVKKVKAYQKYHSLINFLYWRDFLRSTVLIIENTFLTRGGTSLLYLSKFHLFCSCRWHHITYSFVDATWDHVFCKCIVIHTFCVVLICDLQLYIWLCKHLGG